VVETVTKEVMIEKLNSLVTPTTNQTTVAPQAALPIQQQSAINDIPDQQQASSSVDAVSVSDEAEKKET
jgi:hypothetical protein